MDLASNAFNTINWIFSTLAQVWAALAGLMVAGVVFLYPSLNKRVEKDASLKEVVSTIKKRINFNLKLIILSCAGAIISDVSILIIADQLAAIIADPKLYHFNVLQIFICIITVVFNSVALISLISGVLRILDPEFEKKTIDREGLKLSDKQEKEVKEKKKKVVKITDLQYLKLFNQFTALLLAVANKEGYNGKGMSNVQLVNLLCKEGIIPADARQSLHEVIKIGNFLAYGVNIPVIPGSVAKALADTIDLLNKKLEEGK